MDDLMDWFAAAKFKPGGIIIGLSGNVVFFHNILFLSENKLQTVTGGPFY